MFNEGLKFKNLFKIIFMLLIYVMFAVALVVTLTGSVSVLLFSQLLLRKCKSVIMAANNICDFLYFDIKSVTFKNSLVVLFSVSITNIKSCLHY